MIYLNNAATSYPKAPGVAKAVSEALDRLPGAANRGGIEDFDVLAAVRDGLSQVAGIDQPSCIGLGSNATWGLNVGIHGIGLTEDSIVLATTAEHNSVYRPLHALAQKDGIDLHYLPVDGLGRLRIDDWEEAVSRLRPRLCVVTHASNVTGALNDIQALTEIAHRYGSLILVDLAQSLGCAEVRLCDWGVDMAAFTGHKYLLGPQGVGGLYVRPGLELDPYLAGGTGIHSDLDTMPPGMPLRLEAGTNNEPGCYGLLAALRWSAANPWPTVVQNELREHLIEQLRLLGARVIAPDGPCTPVVSFTVEGFSPAYIGETLLDSYYIIVRTGLHCAPRIFGDLGVEPKQGTVRVSLSRFTTAFELEEFMGALREIIEAGVF
jgi:selenocysteine lyase/cysteine desulfurase